MPGPAHPSDPLRSPAAIPTRSAARGGWTLVELLVVLALAGVVLGLVVPLATGILDRWAVSAARDEAMALLRRTRAVARMEGGAEVRISTAPPTVELVVRDTVRTCLCDLEARGIGLELSGRSGPVTLRWNGLGLGVVSSRTLRFTRRASRAELVVSSRGRAVRR